MNAAIRVVLAAALFGASFKALQRHERALEKTEYLSIPARSTVRSLAAGFENMTADIFYLQFIHYFGKHLRAHRKYHNVVPVLELITDLDPQFEGAYVMGALALGDNGEVDASEALWDKAMAKMPDRWEIAYQAGMSLFLFGSTPEQYTRAGKIFGRAADLPGAPPTARQMEARMYQVTNRREMAIAVWRKMYVQAYTEEERAVAKRTLEKYGAPLPALR